MISETVIFIVLLLGMRLIIKKAANPKNSYTKNEFMKIALESLLAGCLYFTIRIVFK
jgi:hypothetical protein